MDPSTTAQDAADQFEMVAVPYLRLDVHGVIHQANEATSDLLRLGAARLRGKRLDQFLAPASSGSLSVLLRQVLESGRVQQAELSIARPAEPAQNMLMHLTPAGSVCHALLTDITPYKQAHLLLINERTHQEQEVKNAATRIRNLNEELEEVLIATQQQLHLLLARVTNLLAQAHSAATPTELEAHLQSAGHVTQQVNLLLNSLERYRQTRTMRARLRPMPLQTALSTAMAHVSAGATDRQFTVTHDPLPTLLGDSQALTLILEEYLSNALKFTRSQPHARIHVIHRETTTEHQVGVADNGVGFNMRQKDQLFKLFAKLHSPKEYEGLGVGLPTVRRTCERFGARVWAEGKLNQGATFWFAWPKNPRLY
ncbi:sensor histidine kinase [Deinococcus radiotolerans]|uniref:histidine kinase n=1 Tax=Deinococcus radiotolerans TaxID=1309407 RepID=A0ABQ2FHK0_9DEIO|nr:ATP-binding protein [Deinococcus radiotolerans]GGK99350.1 hypothetical protein GCM10010844_16950 [Deinococcus radiotolerans]